LFRRIAIKRLDGSMNKIVFGLLAVAAEGVFGPAVYAQEIKGLVGVATQTGSCERLIAAGNDFSDHCSTTIIQSIYDTGRTGFTLAIGDKGTVITFSGMEGKKPDPDSQLQSVDKVILNLGIEGVPSSMTDTKGSCSYRNPYNGPMTIGCHALDEDNNSYLLEFVTDGSEPEFVDM
jgi:hypothetical protein